MPMPTTKPITPDLSECKDPSSKTLFALCCVLAALLHVLVFAFLAFWPPAQPTRATIPTVTYQSNTPNTAQQTPPRQVVTIPPPCKQQRPAHADLLAEWDSLTKNPLQGAAAPFAATPSAPQSTTRRSPRDRNETGRRSTTPSSTRKPQAKHPRAGEKKPLGLFPGWRELHSDMTVGSPDDVQNVSQGDSVRLNTIQWHHAAFFNRIKESVVAAWHPQRQLNKHNPDGRGMQGRRHETVVRITIDRGGNLVQAHLVHSSGFAYLDDEALRAFHRAQPFLHPPHALFGAHKRFSFPVVLTVHVR